MADTSKNPPTTQTPSRTIGAVVTVTVGDPVAGGQCIARADGQVVFVRDAIPGEVVDVQITGSGKRGAFLRGDVIEVREPSEHRVEPPCVIAHECGGCDWQHVDVDFQRELKARVVVDAMRRTGGVSTVAGVPIDEAVCVEAIYDGDGLHWRTRMRYAVTDDGLVGLRAARSHRVIPASDCPLAVTPISDAIAPELPTDGGRPVTDTLVAAASSSGEVAIVDPHDRGTVTERARDRKFEVSTTGFWQVHPQAPKTLVDAVLELAAVTPGETVLDLYSGVGLFAAFLAEAVTVTGRVDAIEGDKVASKLGRRNLGDLPWVHHHCAPVERWLHGGHRSHADVVVLDPPRSGAGKDVVTAITRRHPRSIVYVACDPVALARDTKYLAALGYTLSTLRSFDMFPMTKHVESVALFTRT